MPGMNTGLEGSHRRYDTAIFEKKTLDNGIPVWMHKPPILTDDEGILIAFLPKIGSLVDPKDGWGAAHFFEHLPFEGTKSKPSDHLLLGELRSLGGYVNAHTYKFNTAYVAMLSKENLGVAAEAVSLMLQEPLLDQKTIDIERGVIKEEYRRIFRDGDRHKSSIILNEMYGEDHPYSHHPIGTLESIDRITRQMIQDFHAEYYHAGNIQLICAGAFSENPNAMEILNKWFGSIRKANQLQISIDHSLAFAKNGQSIEVKDERISRDSLHLIYSMKPASEEDEYALKFLPEILSGDMHLPLPQEYRVKRGWTYETNMTTADINPDLWTFEMDVPLAREHFKEAEQIFYSTLSSLTPEFLIEQQKRRQIMRRGYYSDPNDEAYSAMSEIATWNKTFGWYETEEKWDEVTIERILKWRDYLLKNKPFVIGIYK